MNNRNNNNKAAFILGCIASLIFTLSACSSDDVAQAINQVITDETITVSGTITRGVNPEAGATVKGFYRNTAIPPATTTTQADGTYTLTVLKDTPVSLQISGSNMATLNSAYESSSVNLTGYDQEVVTEADVDTVIGLAFPGVTMAGGQAWLAVTVMDNAGNDIDGAVITTTPSPLNMIDEAAVNCDGTDSNGVTTIGNCNPSREGPMYLAYFSADAEVTVAVTGSTDQQIAPVRAGEVTGLEFVQ